jgi:DNA polymerase V
VDEVLIYTGEFNSVNELKFVDQGIKAGFPSPADDYFCGVLDFNRDLIKHPAATFYGKVRGDSMKDAGIDDGDIIVIDRSLEAQNGDIVVAFINGEFTIKYLDVTHKDDGYIELIPANDSYPHIRINAKDQFTIWGVVAWTIKKRARLNEEHSL